MPFPVFSRPGKLITKARYLPAYTAKGYGMFVGIRTDWAESRKGWETITSRRNGLLDLERYSIDVVKKHNRTLGSNMGGSPAYVDSDVRIPLLATLTGWGAGVKGKSTYVPLSLLTRGYNFTPVDEVLLASQGATGMARAWPTNPTADTAVFLGELKDGFPAMIGTQLKRKGIKGASGEWLNFQFAISPLFSDFESFNKAWSEGPARLAQLRKDAGRAVRRRRDIVDRVDEEKSTSNVSTEGLYVAMPHIWQSNGLPSKVPVTTHVRRTEQVWFVGSFYYHMPNRLESPALNDLIDNLQYNWGALPSADTAWELMPYSWAVDYFTNVGDVIRNLSRLSQGNQFADAFVMRHVREENTRTSDYLGGLRTTEFTERKTRRRTSPFSLGASADLSGMQWANLLAVGWERHLKR